MEELRLGDVPATDLIRRWGSPLYVLEEERILDRLSRLRRAFSEFRLFFAAKANPERELWRLLHGEGCGIDCCSPGEVAAALDAGIPPEACSYMGTALTEADMADLAATGVSVHLDALSQLRRWAGHVPRGAPVGLRINPGQGAGSHPSCTTAGVESKLGVLEEELGELPSLLEDTGLELRALHVHIGSGSFELAPFVAAAELLFRLAEDHPSVRSLNFGGGLGVPHGAGDPLFDLEGYAAALRRLARAFTARTGRSLDLCLEPGQYLLSEAGWLLMEVVVVKERPSGRVIITDSSFNHYLGTALYQSWHDFLLVRDPRAPAEVEVDIWGHLCNTGDRFARRRPMPRVREGDLLAMNNAGAYGMARASNYNGRPLPAVVLTRRGQARCIRRRQTLADLWAQEESGPWISFEGKA